MSALFWMVACQHTGSVAPIVPTTPTVPIQRHLLPTDSGYPNGVASAPDGTLFVGFVDHGRIVARHPDGVEEVVYPGGDLFSATSLRFDPRTNLLWVTSPDFPEARVPHRVGTVDVERGEVVWSQAVPAGGFGNDVVLDGRGGALLTDSTKNTVQELDARGSLGRRVSLPPATGGSLGAAGIGRLPDGTWVVGQFSTGELLRVDPRTSMATPITTGLENPDGLLVEPSGTILVLEGAVQSGDGRLLRIDTSNGAREVLVSGLDSPLNLAFTAEGVVLTESGIRHLMRAGLEPPEQRTLVDVRLHSPVTQPVPARLPERMFPESVAVDAAGVAYVGSATTHGIQRIEAGETKPFIPAGTNGLMSVQGLWVGDGQLYACTANLGVHEGAVEASALLSFDLESGEPSGHWPLPADGLCNDLTELPDGSLLISDSTAPRIWRFDPENPSLKVWLADPMLGGSALNGNGIAWSPYDEVVYLSTFSDGRLLTIPVREGLPGTPEAVRLSRSLDGADAIRIAGPGRLLLFENGLTGATGGQVTSVVVDEGRGRMVPLWKSEHQPTSGWIHEDGTLTVVESHFAALFGEGPSESTAPPVLRRLTEPAPDLWALD